MLKIYSFNWKPRGPDFKGKDVVIAIKGDQVMDMGMVDDWNHNTGERCDNSEYIDVITRQFEKEHS